MLDNRDYSKDVVHLRYEPGRVTPDRIVEVIRKEGFEGTIVPAPKAAPEGEEN